MRAPPGYRGCQKNVPIEDRFSATNPYATILFSEHYYDNRYKSDARLGITRKSLFLGVHKLTTGLITDCVFSRYNFIYLMRDHSVNRLITRGAAAPFFPFCIFIEIMISVTVVWIDTETRVLLSVKPGTISIDHYSAIGVVRKTFRLRTVFLLQTLMPPSYFRNIIMTSGIISGYERNDGYAY